MEKRWLLLIILALSLLALLSNCGQRDDRDEIRSSYGEPDSTATGGKEFFWYEIWFYYELNLAFEFRRTASKCGGKSDVYLAATYRLSTGEALSLDKFIRQERYKGNPIGP